jgi:dCMP deaminase
VYPDLNHQCSSGYNGMLRGVTETEEMWHRPNKYHHVCHAEFNAVALAARRGRPTDGCTAYITCYPCQVCARLLVQAGIKRIVVLANEVANGYAHEREMTAQSLAAAGIPVYYRR